MNSKAVVITLKGGKEIVTTQTKVTYTPAWVRFVTDDDRKIMYIPWDSIAYVEEVIS